MYLGIEQGQTLTNIDWLLMYQNALLEVTGGAVYHDGLGELVPLRQSLAWYPRDVWLFMLASQWIRLAQEEAFPGRCGEAGDEVGSLVNTARMVRDVVQWSVAIRHTASGSAPHSHGSTVRENLSLLFAPRCEGAPGKSASRTYVPLTNS
jgi:Domain of unknown function (DUF4037)